MQQILQGERMKRTNVFDDIYKQMDNDNLHNDKPYMMDVELTNHCNLRCNMCSRQLMRREQGYMTDETFYRVLDGAYKHQIPLRFIRWGEPFLHPRILEYAKAVKTCGLPLHITTNGLLLKQKTMQALIDMRLDSIIFSMQGTNKDEYNHTRIGGDYDALSKNIKLFHRLRGANEKPYITLTTTINETQGVDQEKFLHYWHLYTDHVKIGRTINSFLSNTIILNKDHPVCFEPFRQLSVNWDGDVTACCGDYDNLLVVGNINTQGLMEIWNHSPVLSGIRSIFSAGCYSHLSLCGRCGFGSIKG
jgi:MoaA/NifB/PqqE/SkfB family radical SAM enzyme